MPQEREGEHDSRPNEEIQEIIAASMHKLLQQQDERRWSGRYNLLVVRKEDPQKPGHMIEISDGAGFGRLASDTLYLLDNGHPFFPTVPLQRNMSQTLRDDILHDSDILAEKREKMADDAQGRWESSFDQLEGQVFVYKASEGGEADRGPAQLFVVGLVYVKEGQLFLPRTQVNMLYPSAAYTVYGIAKRDKPEDILLGQAMRTFSVNDQGRGMRTEVLLQDLANFAFLVGGLGVDEVERRGSDWKIVFPEKVLGSSLLPSTPEPSSKPDPSSRRRRRRDKKQE